MVEGTLTQSLALRTCPLGGLALRPGEEVHPLGSCHGEGGLPHACVMLQAPLPTPPEGFRRFPWSAGCPEVSATLLWPRGRADRNVPQGDFTQPLVAPGTRAEPPGSGCRLRFFASQKNSPSATLRPPHARPAAISTKFVDALISPLEAPTPSRLLLSATSPPPSSSTEAGSTPPAPASPVSADHPVGQPSPLPSGR